MLAKLARKLARKFLMMCYLAGPGTHEAIVSEIAEILAHLILVCLALGLGVGFLVGLIIGRW